MRVATLLIQQNIFLSVVQIVFWVQEIFPDFENYFEHLETILDAKSASYIYEFCPIY